MRRFEVLTLSALWLFCRLALPAQAQTTSPQTAPPQAAAHSTTQPAAPQPADPRAAQQATLPAGQAGPSQGTPQVMGSVATEDALLDGGLRVENERAELVSNASVTAHDRTAAVRLARGGEVLVCATSQLHLLHSGDGRSLLFGLDRGALQIHTFSEAQDVILTPDLRFTIEAGGKLDLGLRVTRDGDTCVDNAGSSAPVLMLNDAFSSASYRLLPGQHVLFEHGNLREVVDNEQFPCGCPTPLPLVQSAEVSGASAAVQHPFPEAASEGLAPETPPANAGPAGAKHTQIAATLSYAEGQGPPPSTLPPPPVTASGSTTAASGTGEPGPAEPPPTPPGAHSIFHSIGRFFHRLFHPGNPPASSGS